MTVTDHYTATGNYQNLFVAKLPLGVTNADLSEVFAAYSPSSATVMLDPVSGRSKGYAFVLFASEQAGRDAAAALDKTSVTIPHPPEEGSPADHITFDLTIFASKHSGREVAAENECLYIRNIPNSWPMEQVEAFIAEHGKPVYSAVRTDHLGSPVWVVFVEYDSVESARRTLKAVHGMSVAPRCPPILAKYAENDDVKRNRRERKLGRNGRRHMNATPTPAATTTEGATDASVATDEADGTAPVEGTTLTAAVTRPRIDAAHQLHNPLHAARFEADGSRVVIPPPVQEAPAPFAIPLPRSAQTGDGCANSIVAAEDVPADADGEDTTPAVVDSATSCADAECNTAATNKAAAASAADERRHPFPIPLPRSKQLALAAAAQAAAEALLVPTTATNANNDDAMPNVPQITTDTEAAPSSSAAVTESTCEADDNVVVAADDNTALVGDDEDSHHTADAVADAVACPSSRYQLSADSPAWVPSYVRDNANDESSMSRSGGAYHSNNTDGPADGNHRGYCSNGGFRNGPRNGYGNNVGIRNNNSRSYSYRYGSNSNTRHHHHAHHHTNNCSGSIIHHSHSSSMNGGCSNSNSDSFGPLLSACSSVISIIKTPSPAVTTTTPSSPTQQYYISSSSVGTGSSETSSASKEDGIAPVVVCAGATAEGGIARAESAKESVPRFRYNPYGCKVQQR